ADLPPTPFYLYLTRTYQKVGWVVMDGLLNEPDNDLLRFAVDMDVFTVPRETLFTYIDYATVFKDEGLSKTEMKTGDVSLRKLKEIKEGGGDPREILTLINS